jgi:CRP-like cAMP-binding protein
MQVTEALFSLTYSDFVNHSIGAGNVRAELVHTLSECSPQARTTQREFTAGEVLFEEGAPASGCHIVRQGRVQLSVGIRETERVIVESVGPGELVGMSALLGRKYRSKYEFTATAMTCTSTLFISSRELVRCLKAHPELRMLVLTALSANVQRIMHSVAALRLGRSRRSNTAKSLAARSAHLSPH